MNKEKVKKIIIIAILLLIGILSRILFIDKQPNALNVDEASSGYEAWSILNYGIDRNGNFLPVFLISWGSGQNALYSYLMIPFIKLLGLNALAVRMPMAIIGCISLIVFYLLIKELKNEKVALVGLAFFVICPWHIMKSRWGLESNIFPDLVLWAVYFIVLALKKNKMSFLYIASVILRFNCICLWNLILLFTIILNTFIDNNVEEKTNKIKRCNNKFKHSSNNFNANNNICVNKFL